MAAEAGISTLGVKLGYGVGTVTTAPTAFKWLERVNSIGGISLETEQIDASALEDMISKIMQGEKVENKNKPLEFTYEELMDIELKLIDATDTYKYNKKYNIYENMTDDKEFMKNAYKNAKKTKK